MMVIIKLASSITFRRTFWWGGVKHSLAAIWIVRDFGAAVEMEAAGDLWRRVILWKCPEFSNSPGRDFFFFFFLKNRNRSMNGTRIEKYPPLRLWWGKCGEKRKIFDATNRFVASGISLDVYFWSELVHSFNRLWNEWINSLIKTQDCDEMNYFLK